MKIWILWKIEPDSNGRLTKVLYSALYDGRASSTNSKTWATYDQAVRKFEAHRTEYKGIGIVISKDTHIIFIDIDHCFRPDGTLSDLAQDIVSSFHNQYIEISQSGSGLHIFALGEIPKSFKNSSNGVEMYNTGRFCAMTGNCISLHDPHTEQDAINRVYEKYKTPPKVKIEHKKTQNVQVSKDDRDIIERIKQDGELSLLYAGEWKSARYVSQSEADLRLCGALAFWTDADPDRIDSIFRTSGLYREKWERADYRESTIQTACDTCKETLSEFIQRRRKEEALSFERVYFQ